MVACALLRVVPGSAGVLACAPTCYACCALSHHLYLALVGSALFVRICFCVVHLLLARVCVCVFIYLLLSHSPGQALDKLGKSEKTVDEEFNTQKACFDEQYKLLKKLKRDVEQYLKSMADMTKHHASIAGGIHSIYENTCPLWSACLEQDRVHADIDNQRKQMENHIKMDFFDPLATMMALYKTIEERCHERERRRVDMDRYAADLKKVTSKKGSEATTKIQLHQEKADAMAAAYNVINQELLRDIPVLLADRFLNLDPMFATIADAQAAYAHSFATGHASLQALFTGVDRSAVHTHKSVITSDELSTYKQAVYMPGSSHENAPHAAPPANQVGCGLCVCA
jgi:bridging integrator 3